VVSVVAVGLAGEVEEQDKKESRKPRAGSREQSKILRLGFSITIQPFPHYQAMLSLSIPVTEHSTHLKPEFRVKSHSFRIFRSNKKINRIFS